MAKFLRNIFLFIPPLVFLFIFPLLVLIKSGELISFTRVVKKQAQEFPVLFGRIYSGNDLNFKIISTRNRGAEVAVLGTSRVLGIRSNFFRPGVTFYNAGRAVGQPSDLGKFLHSLPLEKYPRFIIVGMEQGWFAPNFKPESQNDDLITNYDDPALWQLTYGWKQVYLDYFKRKFYWSDLFKNQTDAERIGLNAVVHGMGFRNDGSFQWGDFSGNTGIAAMIKTINGDQGDFRFDKEISNELLQILNNFLDDSKQHNITVVGFFPPDLLATYQNIQTADSPINKTLKELFSRYGFHFYDFSNITTLGGSYNEFIDTSHASEKIFARIFIALAKQDVNLDNLIDTTVLKKALLLSLDNHKIFEK